MPRDAVIATLRGLLRRYRLAAVCSAVVAGAALAGVVVAVSWLLGASPEVSRVTSIAAFVLASATLAAVAWRRLTPARVAALAERHVTALENLLVTSEEIVRVPSRLHPAIEAEIFDAASARLAGVPLEEVQPLGRPASFAIGSAIAVAALLVAFPASHHQTAAAGRNADEASAAGVLTSGDLRVSVHPPAYAGRAASSALNPAAVAALEGSRVQLEVGGRTDVALVDLNGSHTAFVPTAAGSSHEFVATDSRPLLVRQQVNGEAVDRLVHLRVERDERPLVRITAPAKDVLFPEGKGSVAVAIEARDDIGLRALALRYTRVSGSGETFTFEEGEWPVRIDRTSAGEWKAQATLGLDGLKLDDGDAIVYRAVVRDTKPGADPVASDSYLIEIGRLAGIASTGFALPEDRDRQAISQQMLIIKTERLQAERGKMPAEEFAQQSRMLAVEQRMVKAEFVFMTGGVVEDEVEEAEHSHELAEGRMENTGQAELLAAIREMSRAEARLNAVDITQALEFERAALRALQRAFDRRRYLLRTLPERARIDTTRRLTGELQTARSSSLDRKAAAADPFVERAREVLRELASDETRAENAAVMASHVVGLDPASDALQQAAVQLSSAGTDTAREEAVRAARRAVLEAIAARLPPPAPSTGLRSAPIEGRLVQELSRGTPR